MSRVFPFRTHRLRRIVLASTIAVVAVVAGLGVAACGGVVEAPAVAATGEELQVTRKPFAERLLLSGEIAAEEAVIFVAPNVGVWPLDLRGLADDGSAVAAGDIVVRFDNSSLTWQIETLYSRLDEASNSLAASIEQARDAIAQAEFELTEARGHLQKAEIDAAVPAELMAEQEIERRRLERDKALLEVEAAEKELQSAREEGEASVRISASQRETARRAVERVESDIAALVLEAPQAGLVLVSEDLQHGRPLRIGDSVFPGLEVARLPDLGSLYVEARLFDVDDGRLEPGQRVVATLDAYPDEPLEGRVRTVEAIAEQVNASSARRVFRVTIDLESVDAEWMLPGMSVKVEVADAAREALVVPRAALAFAPKSDGLVARARLAAGGWAEIELGPCDGQRCVVAAGLDDGVRLAPARETM
ncbi:MAG: efflux RND transporter periplasmic adaptor subunit [Acidobacteriota bacterium]